MKTKKIYLPEKVGKGYKEFWDFKGRYLVCKGSRASKKSKTTALKIIYRMMQPQYREANAIVFRKTYRTLKDSCFSDLRWAIHRFEVDDFWETRLSPLEITYKPTGQKILFRGLDDPLKVTSISVDKGYLCWAWLEEAYELLKEEDFDMIDESIRGAIPDPLYKQWIITFNPWNEKHWIKRRFFDRQDDNILAMTTNYKCNEWLDASDLKLFEDMRLHNPRRYRVAGLGDWGIVEGLIYENWVERSFTLDDIRHCQTISGLDFGYTNDPTAFLIGFIDQEAKKLYIWDEIYKKGLTNRMIYQEIQDAGYAKEKITADSAEPKSIDELRELGLRVHGARKGRDSINNGIQYIQDYQIIVHPRCVNFLTEINNYTWDSDKFGDRINVPIDDFNHLMDALRYAVSDLQKGAPKVKTFRGGI
ncbi:PBSX family phage terminase large subunit [Faecalicoccus pleomorphus]|uniref:PBSX family phage terminase large subunit n=1 Tax=Faecalicoccus pleomorphus TaxID=1323 RepID=UPI00195FECF1|nr:PBSX family phage terminase large subunit [Faecalicoccus pleomorphus]